MNNSRWCNPLRLPFLVLLSILPVLSFTSILQPSLGASQVSAKTPACQQLNAQMISGSFSVRPGDASAPHVHYQVRYDVRPNVVDGSCDIVHVDDQAKVVWPSGRSDGTQVIWRTSCIRLGVACSTRNLVLTTEYGHWYAHLLSTESGERYTIMVQGSKAKTDPSTPVSSGLVFP
ncbi:MAG: hypothetical protein AVDCRST_MAG93-639 [uncultured Chloroflexia bacterium]|uniref:Uncharacterized protein n=1 Tax=uncultured Chloroflexia bacterium TaxID=1672391 RepID=A0A6J4HLB0_9CHLR|nr:MAG: hypothetical protein AVDCRST_MAG93-639 [uncultured Chloroflexia bacterium]